MKKITLAVISLAFSLIDAYAGEYQLVLGQFTWEEAKLDAESKGGHLFTVTSLEELRLLESQFPKLKFSNKISWAVGALTDSGGVWITGEKNENGYRIPWRANYGPGTYSAGHRYGEWHDGGMRNVEAHHSFTGYILETEDIAAPPNKDKKVLYSVIKPAPPGFSLMSIPFSYKGNRISTIFGDANDITVYDYNYVGGWVVNSYDKEFQEWDIPNHVLEGGSAIWILNQSPSVQYIRIKGNIPTAWRTAAASPTSP